MKFPYFCVNAFCKNSFSGNPAGVCILNDWLSTDDLQKMAYQINLPETAFLFPSKGGIWSIRWFSPKLEIDFCGHATLASAHVIYEQEFVDKTKEIKFASPVGKISASKVDQNSISLNLPKINYRKSSISPVIVEGLGAYPDEIYQGKYTLCIFSDEATIEALNPDFRILASIANVTGIIVSAKTKKIGYHFISRFFAPRIGINEDHVTGSAHCMLAPYWGDRLAKNKLVGWQSSIRGGEVRCEIKNERILLCGKSETFVRGEILF